MANYAFTTGKKMPSVSNGHVFEECNFTQAAPNTEIFKGVTGLVFRRCNLTNCKLPADAAIKSCVNQQIEFCTNLHPEWVDFLSAEDVICSHVVETDEIYIDGSLIDTIYHYADTVQI